MFKPTLGLGTNVETNQVDLNNYLRNLKKKQNEINVKRETDDDSDIPSLAGEYVQDSPFIKKRPLPGSSPTTPLPEKEISFISSKLHSSGSKVIQNSEALECFMKFDKKYSEAGVFRILPDENSEFTEPVSSEEIHNLASILEDKIRPGSYARRSSREEERKRRRSSDTQSTADNGGDRPLSEQSISIVMEDRPPSSLTFKRGGSELKLNIQAALAAADNENDLLSSMYSNLSHPTLTPVSPIYVIEELEESLSEDVKTIEEQIVAEENRTIPGEDSPEKESKALSNEDESIATISELKTKTNVKQANKAKQRIMEAKSYSQEYVSQESNSEVMIKKDGSSKEKKRAKSYKQSCFYCKEVCSYHRSVIKNGDKIVSSSKKKAEKSVQAGPEGGTLNHYLFDPTLDLNYRVGHKSSNFYLSPDSMLTEFLKNQLDLTKNFLDTQRKLYINYCDSLEDMARTFTENKNKEDKIIWARASKAQLSSKEESITLCPILSENCDYKSDFESESQFVDTVESL